MLSQSSLILSLFTDDVLGRILSFIADDDAADRRSFRAVCRSFLRVDSLHRTHLRILRVEYFQVLLARFPRVDSLDLSVCPRIDDATVAAMLGNRSGWAARVRRLVLSRCAGLRFHGLEMLARSCPLLEAVDVSYCCNFGDREAAALSCAARLRDLRLDKCLGVTDVGLAKVAVGCSGLEKLSLKWCFEITDLGIDLLAKKCPHLKLLDISYSKVTSGSLQSISRMQKLEVLAMVGCGAVDDSGLHYLGKGCPLLQDLNISRCDKLSFSALASFISGRSGILKIHASYCFYELPTGFINQLVDVMNLKKLIIDGAPVSDTCFKIISANCKFLVEIGLGKCKGVTDCGIEHLVSGCVNLKVINLTCCGDISDTAISAITESCRDLVCLKLECCNFLTEKSLDLLGSRSFLLEEIDLTDCPGVNDIGLNYLSKCSKLLCLKLGLCSNISDKGLNYVALNCKEIRELDLYRCTGIGDDGLHALSTGSKKLKKLNLSYCSEITDRGMEYLGHLPEIYDLELRGLLNVTATGLTALASGCQRLAELDLKHCTNISDSGFWALAYHSRNLQQINLSECSISDVGLCMVMGNLRCLQDAKLVNVGRVSGNGVELALRACCATLKKVKLPNSFRFMLSADIVNTLLAKGCKIRWD
nr:F-box/LRR-repeat protein 3 [Ipomoea batatas]